ncbi:hypothetical protein K470DRAFT_142418 [Piedraia hortae CBS 480.64]|uniref:Uncharacterized protein n=1 Tax=Piedraia hortae CBS 480.64 TaxID=1314780 RepID=A0A6A7C9B2_9PEZI|nr:hypothetical protein K470DRAFT_142418 [Piedraia hortae CBS 480.64]
MKVYLLTHSSALLIMMTSHHDRLSGLGSKAHLWLYSPPNIECLRSVSCKVLGVRDDTSKSLLYNDVPHECPHFASVFSPRTYIMHTGTIRRIHICTHAWTSHNTPHALSSAQEIFYYSRLWFPNGLHTVLLSQSRSLLCRCSNNSLIRSSILKIDTYPANERTSGIPFLRRIEASGETAYKTIAALEAAKRDL